MNIFGRRAWRKISTAPLLCLSFFLTLAAPAFAQLDQWGYWENGITESWWFSSKDFTKEEAVEAVARWKSIGDEGQSAAGAEWGGVYFSGDETHGTYLRWSPRGGFVIAHVDKCQALVRGLVYGRVEASPTLLQFVPEFSKRASGRHAHSHSPTPPQATLQFVPVAWRGARMLVAEAEMNDFGDYVAGVGKYNYSSDFFHLYYTTFLTQRGGAEGSQTNAAHAARTEEEAGRAVSAPVVPPAYARFLKKPIEGEITAVGKRQVRKDYSYESPDGSGATHARASLTFVTVNVGAARGLKAGMFLRVAEPSEGDKVRITRAGKYSSEGILIRDVDEANAETFFDGETDEPRLHSKIAVRWKLTTSPF